MEVATQAEPEVKHAFAVVGGQAIRELPQDLYIPPDALRIFLEAFEGPLDLLLYLIKKQNLDILNIPIAEVTRQYVEYVELMQELNLELAAEYLVMAAFLAEIKSRLLLPKSSVLEAEEADPRAELARRLQEYERFKQAAESLEAVPRVQRDIFLAHAAWSGLNVVKQKPTIEPKELLLAFTSVVQRVQHSAHHLIRLEPLSIRERMMEILNAVQFDTFREFASFFSAKEGRLGVVVTFIAMLELMRQSLIEMTQVQPYAPIQIRALAT